MKELLDFELIHMFIVGIIKASLKVLLQILKHEVELLLVDDDVFQSTWPMSYRTIFLC